MSIYSYPESTFIDEVAFHKSSGGAARAYLHANPNVSFGSLHVIGDYLSDKGFQVTPYSVEGKPTLEVRGFKTPGQLLLHLKQQKWIDGVVNVGEDKEEKPGIIERIKKRSLFASGFFYVWGDLKFISYGIKGSTPLNIAAGAFYGAGTVSSLIFGRRDPCDLQIHELSQKMAKYINEKNIELPPEAAIHHIVDDHKKGKLKKADDVLRRYPAELMNSFFALAGICIAVAAYRKTRSSADISQIEQYVAKRVGVTKAAFPGVHIPEADIAKLRKEGTRIVSKFHHLSHWLDVGLGSMTFASGMFANLVKEKAPDPDSPKKDGLAGAWEWVQERPLTVAGLGYMVSTLCHAASTGIEWHIGTTQGKKAIFDRGIFVATNLIAELLVAISSKGHGHGVVSDKSVGDTVLALAADLIVKQPVEMQDQLIDHIAHFLGRPEALAMKDDYAKSVLTHQVEAMRNNPWAKPLLVAARKEDAVQAPAAAASPVSRKPETSGWQAKVAVADPTDSQPQMSA